MDKPGVVVSLSRRRSRVQIPSPAPKVSSILFINKFRRSRKMRKQVIIKIEKEHIWEIIALIFFYCFLLMLMTEEKVILISGISWLLCFVFMGINRSERFWEFSSTFHDHLRIYTLISGIFFFMLFNSFP